MPSGPDPGYWALGRAAQLSARSGMFSSDTNSMTAWTQTTGAPLALISLHADRELGYNSNDHNRNLFSGEVHSGDEPASIDGH